MSTHTPTAPTSPTTPTTATPATTTTHAAARDTLRSHRIPATIWLGGIVVLLFLVWLLGLHKSIPENISPNTPPQHNAPSPPSPPATSPGNPRAHTLEPNRWLNVQTDGGKVQFDWNTPDRRVRVRIKFWNGEVHEEDLEYGHPTKNFGSAPAHLEFFHPQGGTVWITRQ